MSSNYRKYLKASPSSPVLVREVTQSLYSEAGDQACDLVLQVRLVETGWKLVAGPIHNDGDQITTHTTKYMTGFSSTKGRESTVSAGFSLAFKGLGFNMGAEHKEISSETVSGSKEVTKEYKVGPGKSLWVYQRYFKYEQYWRWRLDAWGQMWRVAAWDGGPFELIIPCIEDTTEELSTGQELTGTTQIQVQGVESSVNFNLPGKPIGDAPRASRNAIEAQHAQYKKLCRTSGSARLQPAHDDEWLSDEADEDAGCITGEDEEEGDDSSDKYAAQRAQKQELKRRAQAKELSARPKRETVLWHALRELEMQKYLMASGARTKICGPERISQDGDDGDNDAGSEKKRGVVKFAKQGDVDYAPRDYKWRSE